MNGGFRSPGYGAGGRNHVELQPAVVRRLSTDSPRGRTLLWCLRRTPRAEAPLNRAAAPHSTGRKPPLNRAEAPTQRGWGPGGWRSGLGGPPVRLEERLGRGAEAFQLVELLILVLDVHGHLRVHLLERREEPPPPGDVMSTSDGDEVP